MDMKRRIQVVVVGLAVGAASMIGAGTALAQDGDDAYLAPTTTVAPEVLGVQEERGEALGVSDAVDAVDSAEVAGAAQVEGAALAFTGGDALGLALIGGVALAGGTALVFARRRSANG